MKKLNLMLVLLFCVICSLFAFVGCADNPDGNGTGTGNTEQTTPDDTQGGNTGSGDETEKPQQPSGGNILVVYFSCTNTTKSVAEKIATASDATLYRILPEVPYTAADLNYSDSECRANQEQQNANSRPAISGSVENISGYDTVFIGYPIWWGTLPKIIYTFMDAYDLSEKTIIPFCTSGGSGISASVNAIKQEEPNATVLDGRRFYGNVSQSDINAWVDGLNIKKSEEKTQMQISVKNSEYEIVYELNESTAAKELSAQLPLTLEVKPFSNNEITFYPPKKLNTANTPLSDGKTGSLSYYAPWGDVVMFYAPCSPNGSLYEIGKIVSGTENINKLTGSVTVSVK